MARAQLYWYFHNSVSDDKKQMVANVEKQLEEARELVCFGFSYVNCKFLQKIIGSLAVTFNTCDALKIFNNNILENEIMILNSSYLRI